MISIQRISCLTISTVLLLIDKINAEQAQSIHKNFNAADYSWEIAHPDIFLCETDNPLASYFQKNETQPFRIIMNKVETWYDFLNTYEDLRVELINWLQKCIVIWNSKKTGDKSTMLYGVVKATSNNLLIIDSGNESSIQISVLIRSAAKFNLYTVTRNASAVCCKRISDKSTPLPETICDTEQISPNAQNIESGKKVHSWMPQIFAFADDQRHYTHHNRHHISRQIQSKYKIHHTTHSYHVFGKYRKKPTYQKKYGFPKQGRIYEALKKGRKQAFDGLEAPTMWRKQLCKYRKSCYATGIVPDTWNLSSVLPEFIMIRTIATAHKKADETNLSEVYKDDKKEGINEAKLKLLCHYRISCYKVVNAKIEKGEKGVVNVQITSIFSKRAATTLPPKKQKSIKDIARTALAKAEEREKAVAQRPLPKKVIIDKKLNEIEEQMQKRLACKYRKSCYYSGIIPEAKITYNNPLPEIVDFLKRQFRRLETQQILHKEFNDLEEIEKKIYCKYRKSCYATGKKPVIKHDQIFKYEHIVRKQEELIPLEKRCKYRKSCYETGILPELRQKKTVKEEESRTMIQTVVSLHELKLLCKYRKSCYKQKAREPGNAHGTLSENITEMDTIATEIGRKQKVEEEEATPPSLNQIEFEESKKIYKFADEKRNVRKAQKSGKASKKPKTISHVDGAEDKDEKTEDIVNRSKKKKVKKAAAAEKGKHWLTEKNRKVSTATLTATKAISEDNLKTSYRTLPTKSKKMEREMKEFEVAGIKHEKTAVEKQTLGKEELQLKKPDKFEQNSLVASSEVEERSPTIIKELTTSQPHNTTLEMLLPKKVNIHDENLSLLEIKLLCKYRKSCYKSGEVPPILLAKTITSLRDKDDQYIPQQIRCKYRKSCYETGKLPELHKNTGISEVIGTKENHIPLTLRCKYRKSCYETGELPPITKNIFGFATLQYMMKKYEEEKMTELQEFSQQEIRLRCKYRKSCYDTGILPPRLNQTIHVIASSINKQYISQQLRCKYRISCYESIKLDVQMDKVRKKLKKKPSEGIIRAKEPAVKYREHRGKKHKERMTDKEREDLQKDRQEKKHDDPERQYMQIKTLDIQQRPATQRLLTSKQKLKCKYRLNCYDGIPLHQILKRQQTESERQYNIKNFRRANGAACNIYYISCRKQAGLPIRERAPKGPNGRRLCRKKKKEENASRTDLAM